MRHSPEFDLISEIRERLALAGAGPRRNDGTRDPTGRVRIGSGDDAAVTVPGGATATTVDATVDGIHFRSSWCPPMSVGRKAMAVNLSDIAAMAGKPRAALVSVALPTSFSPPYEGGAGGVDTQSRGHPLPPFVRGEEDRREETTLVHHPFRR